MERRPNRLRDAFTFRDGRRLFALVRGGSSSAPLERHAAARLVRRVQADPRLADDLERWARRASNGSLLGERAIVLASVLRDIGRGQLRALELEQTPIFPHHPQEFSPTEPKPEFETEPIVVDERALALTQCPAVFDPARESLLINYLLRGLSGKPVELVIRSAEQPDPPVHRRWLDARETGDGPGALWWDGIDANHGELVERTQSPFRVELVYDERLRDEATTALPPPPHAHFLELEDLVFATDREVLLPECLGALIVILEFAREHPDKRLLVAGHTDTVGSDADNQALSERRAENVRLWLAGDPQGWAAHCQANFEIADFKAIHAWAHRHLGWSTDPGALDNAWHGKARVARDVFRRECEALLGIELEHGVAQNEADWRAIHDLYALLVGRYLELESDDLLELRRSLHFCDPPILACGEDFPRDRPGQDDVESASNRRVDVLFFDPGEQPDLGVEPAGIEIYGEKKFELHELTPQDLDPLTPAIYEIHIQLFDHWHRAPVADTDYSLAGPLPERLFQRKGSTDPDGLIHEELLPSGHYELVVGDISLIVISHPVGFSDPGHPQIGPKFPDVYRVAGYGFSPVFPPRPTDEGGGSWIVPGYVPGPDHEVVIEEPDSLDELDE